MAFNSNYSGTFGGSKGFTLNRLDTDNDSFDGSRADTRLGLSGNVDLNQDLGGGFGKYNNPMISSYSRQGPFNERRQYQATDFKGRPNFKSSMSDIVDQEQKDALQKSSMRGAGNLGGFEGTFSPGGQSMGAFMMSPKDSQPGLGSQQYGQSQFMSPNTSPTKRFSKFIPRAQKKELNKQMINEMQEFIYTPKKLFCPKHKDTEIEFCCVINETFYCKLCIPKHLGHDDLVLADVCKSVQEDVIKLKHTYVQKKQTIISKLDSHQEKLEDIFKVYYDTLDDLRDKMLGQEYKLRDNMDIFEKTIRELMRDVKSYNYIEFYHEHESIKSKIRDIKDSLKSFNIYMPKYQLSIEDINLAVNQIKVDIKERVHSMIRETDHSFALDNYRYIMTEHMNEDIAKIYKQLGPFDFFSEKLNEEVQEDKSLISNFEKRKSGALFKGEIGSQTGKPDGKGFKVFPNGSIYEGHFADGHTHGLGRGITSRGEVFQGQFKFDMMDGIGFFQWPDGRMYDGDWRDGKKQGQGVFYWSNGQVYEGEFYNDECHGKGAIYYPDGKKFEGAWKNGKKNGKCFYTWPNGAKYHLYYINGKKQGEGRLENSEVSLEQLKENYQSLSKKSLACANLLQSQNQPYALY